MKISKLIGGAILAAILFAGCHQGGGSGKVTSSANSPAVSQTPEEAGYESYDGSEEAVSTNEPTIKLLSHGSVLPSTGKMDLLFSSCGYVKARFRVRKIFTSNILQFMQFDTYEAKYNLFKVARVVADTTVVLGTTDAPHLREERNYGISMDELIKPEPGAIYFVEIRGMEPLEEEDFWDSDTYFGNYETYDERNTFLVASDLALIAKSGDNKCEVFACDILSGEPLKGVKIKLYDDVLQEVGKAVTDKDGCASFPAGEGKYVLASSDRGAAYLALKNEKSLSTSNFDVSGVYRDGGIKAYIFGERGVWRPGDTMHITVITMAEGDDLPAGHPVVAELLNPDGQVTSTLTARNDGSHIYHFPFTTEQDAPTGRWRVDVKIGAQSFSKSLRVETVKPNKLDVQLTFEDELLVPKSSCIGILTVKWLYGAPGSGLKVNGDVELSNAPTNFKNYPDYDFKDDSRSFTSQSRYYSDMRTDSNGQLGINTNMDLRDEGVPGMLNISFTMRAFEPSGEFSTGVSSFKMSPFDTYVGMKVEKDRSSWGEEYLKAGKSHKFDVVTVGPDGAPVTVSDLHVEVFHVDWSWWWNSSAQLASYMSGSSKECLFDKHIATRSGSGSFSYDWADAPEGLYFIRVSDEKGGHATSMLAEVYENYGGSSHDTEGAASRLSINVNKDKYKVGETARLVIPSAKGNRALVSLEKGGRILSSEWVNCSAESTEIKVPVTADMLPNVYAFVTMVQPHAGTLNDAPIRMYGVCNINVEDEASHLQPVIDIASEVKPESEISFKVKEKNGKAMSYVVALVDEGLLGLTGFKTPDAWKAFYAKEALRVRTWDLYDDVIGAYGGKIEQLFAIGGDDEAADATTRPQNAQRFKPVVSYLGPFTLKAGKTATLTAEIPQYIGSLRAMVIATDGRAQGSCSSNVSVTKPVMVQATLPRTMNVGETISVPVTVMTLKDGVGAVKVGIKASDLLEVRGPAQQQVNSAKAGTEMCYFELKVKDVTGIAKVGVTAEAAGDKSAHDIEIDVLNPNPEVTRSSTVLLAAGESKEVEVQLFGTPGTNSAALELSTIPAIDLDARLKYLVHYPYGCLEQTVSSAFPQLYLDKVMNCDEKLRTRSRINIEAAIRRLQNYRRSDGSLSYWPGSSSSSLFGSAYALHFLKEAEDQGYAVPVELKKELIAWLGRAVSDNREDATSRAYGVYALAVAGKPQRGAMNLLREKVKKMPAGAAWLLSAAYAVDGKKNVAREIAAPLQYEDKTYEAYGSSDRNRAVALKTMLLTDRKEEAFRLASDIASRLNDKSVWMSTQSTAWSLYSVCDYARANAGGVQASWSVGGKTVKAAGGKCIESAVLPVDASAKSVKVKIENAGQGNLYAVASVTGVPPASEEKAVSNRLKMSVSYTDENNNPIRVDTLSRGRVVYAVVTVTNPGAAALHDLALNHKFPSGWEIQNERLYSQAVSYPSGVSYQDIRDDRVYSFFDLGAGASVVVKTKLIATYPGRFYLPAVSCEAMYDASVSALIPGLWVEVK